MISLPCYFKQSRHKKYALCIMNYELLYLPDGKNQPGNSIEDYVKSGINQKQPEFIKKTLFFRIKIKNIIIRNVS